MGRMHNPDVISVDSFTKNDMRDFANHLEEYLELYQDCMVLPDDMPKRDKKMIKWAVHKVKELIKKLRKGDIEVFEDPEEYVRTRVRPF